MTIPEPPLPDGFPFESLPCAPPPPPVPSKPFCGVPLSEPNPPPPLDCIVGYNGSKTCETEPAQSEPLPPPAYTTDVPVISTAKPIPPYPSFTVFSASWFIPTPPAPPPPPPL